MQVFCTWSGIEFNVSSFTHKAAINSIHPFFYATPRQVYNREADWYTGKLNDDEKKLLFVVMLYKTELVKITTTCNPSLSTVQKHMERLIEFFNWKLDTIFDNNHFPHYKIDRSNSNLAHIGTWLKELLEFKNPEYYRKAIRRNKLSLVTKEAALERLIKSHINMSAPSNDPIAQAKRTTFKTNMANWFFETANVPEYCHENWRRIILYDYTDFKLYKEDSDIIDSMLLWAEEKLEHGTIFSNTILTHIRELLVANEHGIEYFLGLHEKSGKLANGEDFMIEDDEEAAAVAATIADAPLIAPTRDMFPADKSGNFAFMTATAKFRLAQKAAETRKQITDQQQKIAEADEADIIPEDEAEIEAIEDEADEINQHFRSI